VVGWLAGAGGEPPGRVRDSSMQHAGGLEFEVHGDGEPVLLVHGSQLADAFLPLMEQPALAGRFQLIRYHRRGFAGSARHTGPFGIEAQAQDALLLAQHLGVERLHAVGHSYGALTALQLALDAPHAVRSLVLLEPPLAAPADAPARAALLAPLVEQYRAGDARGAVDAFMSIVGGADWRVAVEKALPGAPEQAYRDAATFFEVEAPALAAWRFDAERARRLAAPVLFLSGSASGPIFEAARRLFLSAVPQAEDVVLPGLDHLLTVRSPGLVARAIAEFLARHPL
jgi:pimeloyl-ACP methyl ester carboxylesterase